MNRWRHNNDAIVEAIFMYRYVQKEIPYKMYILDTSYFTN